MNESKGNSGNNNVGNTFNTLKNPAELRKQYGEIGHKAHEVYKQALSAEKTSISNSAEQNNSQNNSPYNSFDQDVNDRPGQEVIQPAPVMTVQKTEAPKQETTKKGIVGKALEAIKNLLPQKKPSKNYLLLEHASERDRNSKSMRKLLKDIDRSSKKGGVDMPRELGDSIEAFVNNPEYWIGVHRSWMVDGSKFEHDTSLQNIMKEGLINFGDSSSGSIRKDPKLNKTLDHCDNMMHTTIYLKNSYKGSTGAILVAIPRKYLEKGYDWADCKIKPGAEDYIYNHNSTGNSVIKPEYIMGFVQNLGKGSTLQFKTRNEILAAAAEDEKKEQSQQ